MKNKTSIILDTSVMVAALFGSRAKEILNGWERGSIQLCYSQPVLKEYQHIIGKIPPLRKKAQRFFTQMQQSPHTIFIKKPASLRIKIDDPDDKKFIECAVAAKAEAIVSLDAHLLDIGEYDGIPILRPVPFLKRWQS